MAADARFHNSVGLRFLPTDIEIVGYYLRKRLFSGTDSFHDSERFLVKEGNLYGSLEPWQMWDMYGGRQLEATDAGEALYFFTQHKKKSVNGSRICRRVASGTWAGEDSGERIIAGDVVGFKKRFRYENPDSPHHGAWIMHEFSIDKNDIVCCRLKKNVFGLRGAEKKRKLQSCAVHHGARNVQPQQEFSNGAGPASSTTPEDINNSVNPQDMPLFTWKNPALPDPAESEQGMQSNNFRIDSVMVPVPEDQQVGGSIVQDMLSFEPEQLLSTLDQAGLISDPEDLLSPIDRALLFLESNVVGDVGGEPTSSLSAVYN